MRQLLPAFGQGSFFPKIPIYGSGKTSPILVPTLRRAAKISQKLLPELPRIAERTGAYLLNDATDPDLPAGPATISCEILEQLPETTTIIVPVGDSALIRGVAFAARHLSPTIRVIGVQAEQAPAYYLSWKQGRVIETDSCNTIADGLATRSPVGENVTTIRQLVADMCLVTEQDLLVAVRRLAEVENLIAEPAGAAALAAYLARAAELSDDATVLIVSGGNVAPEVLASALHC